MKTMVVDDKKEKKTKYVIYLLSLQFEAGFAYVLIHSATLF